MNLKTMYMLMFLIFFCGCSILSDNNNDQAGHEEKVHLSEFQLLDKNGNITIEMKKTGQFYLHADAIGVLHSNGKMFNQEGSLIAMINDSNILVNSEDQPLIKINKNGVLDNGSGILMHWLDNGEFAQGDQTTGIKLSPKDSSAKQAASMVLFLYLFFEKQ